MAPATWGEFQEGSHVSKQRKKNNHAAFYEGQIMKRILETVDQKLLCEFQITAEKDFLKRLDRDEELHKEESTS